MNYLYRGGEKILIEKEAEFFTTLVPNERSLSAIERLGPVEDVEQVFSDIYRIRTDEDNLDALMQDLRATERTGNVCHHVYHPVNEAGTLYYLTDLLVVAFQPQTTTGTIEQITAQHGLKFVRTFGEEAALTFLLQVTLSAGKNPIKVSEDLNERPEVLFAEPNLINQFQPFYTPQDDLFRHQWHLSSRQGVELLPDAHINALGAWRLTKGSRQVVVAMIDDGFDLHHPDLSGPGKVVFPKDFVDRDTNPFPDLRRGDYHGTPCAGIAIGEENGQGIVGVAPRCAFMPIRFGMTADDRLLYEIFAYAGQHADVISNSWGPVPGFVPLPSLLRNQLAELTRSGGPRGQGCVIVFAAGNYNAPVYGQNIESFVWRNSNDTLRETSGTILNGFATHPDVIAVSASTSQNRKAAYSNWGKEISLCAPSNNNHPLEPQMRLPGRAIWTSTNLRFGRYYTDNFGGTSAACPMVAGVAALVLSANPDLDAQAVREILQATADKIVDQQPDPVFQLRKGTYNQQGHSEWFGYGKVNAARAVQRALELRQPQPEPQPEPQPSPAPALRAGIHIIAAMVNPTGPDRGNEMVALFNGTDQVVDLAGWSLRNRRGETEVIDNLLIEPGFNNIVFLKKVLLPNFGGSIALLNPAGETVDEVSYTFAQGMKAGWWVRF